MIKLERSAKAPPPFVGGGTRRPEGRRVASEVQGRCGKRRCRGGGDDKRAEREAKRRGQNAEPGPGPGSEVGFGRRRLEPTGWSLGVNERAKSRKPRGCLTGSSGGKERESLEGRRCGAQTASATGLQSACNEWSRWRGGTSAKAAPRGESADGGERSGARLDDPSRGAPSGLCDGMEKKGERKRA